MKGGISLEELQKKLVELKEVDPRMLSERAKGVTGKMGLYGGKRKTAKKQKSRRNRKTVNRRC